MNWLAQPSALVVALCAAIPRLQAEEAIARVNVAIVAASDESNEDATAIRDRWVSTINDGRTVVPEAPAPKQPIDPRVTLEKMGFRVMRVPKQRPTV